MSTILETEIEDIKGITPRQKFLSALDRKPLPGLVPHFELVFYPTMEAIGRVHPLNRNYSQWLQMNETERQLHRRDMAEIYIQTAEKYQHDAIAVHVPESAEDEVFHLIDLIRELSGDKYALVIHGDPTFAIPDGNSMVEFAVKMAEKPDDLLDEAQRNVDKYLKFADQLKNRVELDGFILCSDYCFNTGPFFSPKKFAKFVTPFLKQVIAGYRELGFYVIKHTDGNIMPIVDQIIDANPHALHSIDPQAGLDIAEIVQIYGDKVCICGNVNCGLMQTGTEDEVIASAEYSLEQGMKSPGYIFCTSNCIYTGMPLDRYELILDVWRKKGIRK